MFYVAWCIAANSQPPLGYHQQRKSISVVINLPFACLTVYTKVAVFVVVRTYVSMCEQEYSTSNKDLAASHCCLLFYFIAGLILVPHICICVCVFGVVGQFQVFMYRLSSRNVCAERFNGCGIYNSISLIFIS